MFLNNIPVKVLDGGFSSQLSRHVGEKVDGDPLWTARYLATNPNAVMQTHLDFLKAGADLIMTNTYQASVEGFVKYLNVTPEDSLNLIKSAVDLAKEARDKYMNEHPEKNRPLIVGSVGPYGASLHDGSEYSGSYWDKVNKELLYKWHLPRIQALVESKVDLLALETVPCLKEAELLVNLIKEFPDIKAWLSFSCKDGHSISNGEDFQNAVRQCYDANPNQLVAVGANCISPNIVESLFNGINKGREDSPIPLIVYPNSGEIYTEKSWSEKDKCRPLDEYVNTWLQLGISWIGGCCRTYGEDINRIKIEVSKSLILQN